MVVNKIGEELMKEIDIFEHTRIARHIPRAGQISLKYYERSGLTSEYFIDLDEVFICSNHRTIKFRTPNLDHVYEIFGKFSQESPSVVRTSVVDCITCNPETFKEKLIVVFTMLNLDLNSWLLRTKDPKIPVDEASLYGLCQLYSCHALAYTTGSVWSISELHGNYSVDKLKRHCDIHLVFLEGGILGQLHKKPTIQRLMSGLSEISAPLASVSNGAYNETVQKEDPKQNAQKTSASVSPNQDHTYTSPTPHLCSDVIVNCPFKGPKMCPTSIM